VPVQPNNGKVDLPLSRPGDVDALAEVARQVDPALADRYIPSQARIRADLNDYAFYLSATNPEWFAPFADEVIVELSHAWSPDLASACHLFRGATDETVDVVSRRLETKPASWHDLILLAGVGSEYALNRFADHVRRHQESAEWANRLGMHVGPEGPAVRRFSPDRSAIHAEDGALDALSGLPLATVRTPEAADVTWHNLSLKTEAASALSRWRHPELHLVSPRTYWFELQGTIGADGRLSDSLVDNRGQPFDTHLRDTESDRAHKNAEPLGHRIAPLDDTHIYRNGHVYMTAGVVGVVGGCPIGLDLTPVCTSCEMLMFHAATIEERHYGEGFRSVAFCEDCSRIGIVGSSWN